jgi:hypothetical protein
MTYILTVDIWMYLPISFQIGTENALSTAEEEYITICVTQSDTTYDTHERITHYLSSAHKQTGLLLERP